MEALFQELNSIGLVPMWTTDCLQIVVKTATTYWISIHEDRMWCSRWVNGRGTLKYIDLNEPDSIDKLITELLKPCSQK